MTGKPDFMSSKKEDDQGETEEAIGRPNFMDSKKTVKAAEGEAVEETASTADVTAGQPDYMEEKKLGLLSAASDEPADGQDETAELAAEPAAEPAVEEADELLVEYEVKAGDNLSYISRDHYGTTDHWKKIWEANKDVIKDPNVIRPGMVLKIPNIE